MEINRVEMDEKVEIDGIKINCKVEIDGEIN